MNDTKNQNYFINIAKKCQSDIQKIEFFETYQSAFFHNGDTTEFLISDKFTKELDDAFYVYANMKKMTEDEFENFKDLEWRNFPSQFKIFLFDFFFSSY